MLNVMKDAISWKELNLCLGVMLDILSCSFTSISFLTTGHEVLPVMRLFS